MLSHTCFCPALPSQGCPFHIFGMAYFYLPFFHFFFLFPSFFFFFFLSTCISDGFLCRNDVSVSFLSDMQQLLSLRLPSVSCLLCISPIFLIISRFSSTSCTGLYKIFFYLFSFENLSFSFLVIFVCYFLAFISCCSFVQFMFCLKLPNYLGVGVCDDLRFTHDSLTPSTNIFHFFFCYDHVKAQSRYHSYLVFWFWGNNIPKIYKFKILLVPRNI